MRSLIILTLCALGGSFVGFSGYKVFHTCHKIPPPECAVISQSNINRDGAATLRLVPAATQNSMAFNIESNIHCPFDIQVFVRLDKSNLPNWTLGDLIEAAYLPVKKVRIENGQGFVNFNAETSPAVKIIPEGRYIAGATYLTSTAPHKAAFFAKAFGVDNEALLRGQIQVDYQTGYTNQAKYAEYLQSWLRLQQKARQQGVTKANLKEFEKAFGKAEIEKQGENTLYTFPKVQHSFLVNAAGKPVKIKRYSFEGDVQ